MIKGLHPDVIQMDLNMPVMGGLESAVLGETLLSSSSK